MSSCLVTSRSAKGAVDWRESVLFSNLNPTQLARIERTMSRHRLGDREILFQMFQKAERFFLVERGMIKLYRLSSSGAEKVLEIVQAGEDFGSALMFLGEPAYPANAEAIKASEVLSFDNRTFMAILRESPETCFKLLGNLSLRLHSQVAEIDGLCLQNAPCRLINYLLDQVDPKSQGEVEVRLNAPKHVIASRISVKPETFSRLLKSLSKKGLIRVEHKTIRIPSVAALQDQLTTCDRG